ncbi:hypothetical protein NMS42_002280 [Vibrio cholerae]|nr:hypothetical protein [Vibrio cholerae]
MTITYNHFLKNAYNSCKYKSEYTFKEFVLSRNNDPEFFREWLNANRGSNPDLKFVNSIVKTFINYRHSKPRAMGYILADLQRNWQIQMPLVEGVLTSEYWLNKLSKNKAH